MRKKFKNERGNVWAQIIFWVIFVILVIAGGMLLSINQGWWAEDKIPDQLKSQRFIADLLPEPDEPTEEIVEIPADQSYISQILTLNNDLTTEKAKNTDLETRIAEKESQIQDLEDEIVRLQSVVDLTRGSNLSGVALIHENMEPQDSADALQIMGADQASLILGAMRESKAAEILELMDESMVVDITRLMAGFTESEE